MKNNLAKDIENVQNNYVQTIKPTMVDDVLKFEATLGNGAQEIGSDNIGTKLDLSEGHIDMFSRGEMDDSA
eukprot:10245004-Ditylum_brightwellii.AAC.1